MIDDRRRIEIAEAMDEQMKARRFTAMLRRWPSIFRWYGYYAVAKHTFNYLFEGREDISEKLREEITDIITNIRSEFELDFPGERCGKWEIIAGNDVFFVTEKFMMYMMENRPRRGGMAGAVLRQRLEALAREPWGGLVPFGIRHGPGGYRIPAGFRRAPAK